MPFIYNTEFQPFIKIGCFPQPFGDNIKIICMVGKDFFIGQKGDSRPGIVGFADDLQLGLRYPAFVTLAVLFAVTPDSDLHPLRQSVHYR